MTAANSTLLSVLSLSLSLTLYLFPFLPPPPSIMDGSSSSDSLLSDFDGESSVSDKCLLRMDEAPCCSSSDLIERGEDNRPCSLYSERERGGEERKGVFVHVKKWGRENE